jgi:hypothetical protein
VKLSKMNKKIINGLAMIALAVSTNITLASGGKDTNYCMDVVIEPFHMMPDMQPEGSCTVRDYRDGQLQQKFYPFTDEEHLFNCEYFGPVTPLPTGVQVPSAVVSQGNITGTIGGHPFKANLACASLTNWYQDSCLDAADPATCSFQLAQPHITTHPRVTEVSIFDGVISVDKGRHKMVELPIVMATRAAGITHLEDISAPLVGASITHSLLGLATYEADEDDDFDSNESDHRIKVLDGSADLLLQGHIFHPGTVEEDAGAAVIKGSICSKTLYRLLNK